jgi:Pvc16 N-terminal domain
MSETATALSIGSVTAVLRGLLGNGLVRYASHASLGDASVSVLPPDRISTDSDESNRLNLFLYRIAPHTSLKKAEHKASAERAVTASPRVVLNLYYLLTAYGAQDFNAEILLGVAVHLLGRTPILTADSIRSSLNSDISKDAGGVISPTKAALSAPEVISQFDEIRVTPQFLSFDEMSKLWSALQAKYRPSLTYEVSAVAVATRQ